MARGGKRKLPAMEQKTDLELMAGKLHAWRTDPVFFFSDALGVTLSNQQRDFLRVLREMMQAKRKASEGRKLTSREADLSSKFGISIHSAKGQGKDFAIAGLTPWFLLNHDPIKGIVTAPTAKQLDDIYTMEVRKLVKNSTAGLSEMFDIVRGGIYLKDGAKRTENFFTKRTAVLKGTEDEQGETLQGYHERYQIIMVDEASGLPRGAFSQLVSTLTGYCNLAILIGNPTRSSGYFYDTHYDPSLSQFWECLRWSALDSDIGEIVPGYGQYLERMRALYDENDPPYRINVLGLPPLDDESTFIPMDWIHRAVDDVALEADAQRDPIVFGVDVGRGGDKSVVFVLQGRKHVATFENNDRDTMVVAKWVDRLAADYEPQAIGVDVIGLGAGVCDRLREMGRMITEINVSTSASEPQRFQNLRAEIFSNVRDALQAGEVDLQDDQELRDELSVVTVKRWEPRMLLKSKKDLRAIGIPSSNKADAFALAWHVRGDVVTRMSNEEVDAYERAARQVREADEMGWLTA